MPDPRFNIALGPRIVARRVSRKAAAAIVASMEIADEPGVRVLEAVTPRFRVKRHKGDDAPAKPWAVKDAARPAFIGSYATHELAMRAIDNVVRGEREMPPRLDVTVDEIREAMSS